MSLKEEKTKILFIAWDDPKVNYLEGLFAPIFDVLSKKYRYEFHIIQFSWATAERIQYLTEVCLARNISYVHFQVSHKPIVAIGKIFTLFFGIRFLAGYLKANGIGIVMPRSTMPACMVLSLKKKIDDLKVIFDADGLPIEERVDFAGLKKGGARYKQLKGIEKEIILIADLILTRTRKAADFLLSQYHAENRKFFLVQNGRDESLFKPSTEHRRIVRSKYNIPGNATVLVYAGSAGPQYGAEQMMFIYERLKDKGILVYFLILTNSPGYFSDYIKDASDNHLIIDRVPFESIPACLSAADFAFALRSATFSMRGVSPVKLGEYLLMGLPVIASAEIGDTTEMLQEKSFAYLLEDFRHESLEKAVAWVLQQSEAGGNLGDDARQFAVGQYGLSQSAKAYHTAIQHIL